jgi:hypothetical protein
MIVYLNQKEIHTALIEYISNQGYPVGNKKVEVSLVAGRGTKGHSAQLSFETVSMDMPAAADTIDNPDERQQAIMFESLSNED